MVHHIIFICHLFLGSYAVMLSLILKLDFYFLWYQESVSFIYSCFQFLSFLFETILTHETHSFKAFAKKLSEGAIKVQVSSFSLLK